MRYNKIILKNIYAVGRFEQDVGFGNSFGFQTLCVLYYGTEEQLYAHSIPNEIPDFWVPRFADLATVLADLSLTANRTCKI